MRSLLLALLLALPAQAQFNHRSNPGDPKTAGQAITTAGASNCPGTGCVVLGTQSTEIVWATIAGTWSATLSFLCSNDGWVTTKPLIAYPVASNGSTGTGVVSTTANGDWLILPFACREVAVFATSFASNTSMVVRLDGDPIAGFVKTSDVKDGSARTFLTISADGVTPAVSETVITFSQNKAGTVTGSATTYAVTAGKTLRIQSLCASFTAGAAANRVRLALRLNTGGACVAGSGLLLTPMELVPQYGTATAAEGGAVACMTIPDGLELSGTTWNLCLTESAAAASGTLTVGLVGYEY